jgi:hypothetical protein
MAANGLAYACHSGEGVARCQVERDADRTVLQWSPSYHLYFTRLGRLNAFEKSTIPSLRASDHPASHETVDCRIHFVHQEGQQVSSVSSIPS